MTLARVPAPPKGSVQRPPPRPGPAFGTETRSSRLSAAPLVAALVLVAVAAAAAYAVGTSGRHTAKDASAARRSAEQQAFASAQRDLTARGRGDGLRAGTTAGASAGRVAGRRASATQKKSAAPPAPGQIKDCKTPIRQKSFVSSVKGISCAAAAGEQLAALKAGHPARTPKGFTCQTIDPTHHRCTKGAQAYRWDISP